MATTATAPREMAPVKIYSGARPCATAPSTRGGGAPRATLTAAPSRGGRRTCALAVIALLLLGAGACKRKQPAGPGTGSPASRLTPLDSLSRAAADGLPDVVQEQIRADVRAAEERPADPMRIGKVAMLYHAHGFNEAALQWYAAAVERCDRVDADFQAFLCRYYQSDLESRENPHLPVATMTLALNRQPEDIHALLRQAQLFHVVYNTDVADESTRPTTAQMRRAYTRVIERDQSAAAAKAGAAARVAHCALGEIELAAGNAAEAVEHYTAALTDAPDYLEARDGLITAYDKLGKTTEADALRQLPRPEVSTSGYVDPYMADFHRMTSLASAKVEHALRLLKQGITAEAESKVRAMIAEDPRDAVALDALGTITLSKLSAADAAERGAILKEASEQFRAAAEADPDFTQPKLNFAITVHASGDTNAALTLMQSLARYVPHDWRVRYYFGEWLAQEAKRRAEAQGPAAAQELYLGAIKELSKCLELNPLNMFAAATLADVLNVMGRYDEMHVVLRQAAQRAPDDPGIANKLALLLATSDVSSIRDPVEAVRIMLRVDEVTGGKDPEYLETLAIAYAATEDYEAAARAVNNALDEAALQQDEPMKARLTELKVSIDARRMGK